MVTALMMLPMVMVPRALPMALAWMMLPLGMESMVLPLATVARALLSQWWQGCSLWLW